MDSDAGKTFTYLHGMIQGLSKIGRHTSDAFH